MGKSESFPDTNYTDEQLLNMSHEEKVKLGLALDGVKLIFRADRFPEPGTKAEARANRLIAFWIILGTIFSIVAFFSYLFWPHEFQMPTDPDYWWYTFYTPVLGLSLGASVLCVGIATVLYVKKILPEEIAVQDRHDGGSAELDKATTVAVLKDSLVSSTFTRRKLIYSSLIGFGAFFGLSAVSVLLGGLIKNPWAKRDKSELWHSGWSPSHPGEVVYLRRYTNSPYDVVLVRPEELQAGAMETVFPWKVSDGFGETAESREKLLKAVREVRNPVMLMRFHPEDTARAIKRKGQEDFNYGDYWAYTKVCSHLGCPTSLFEQQTHHILCPCHQSQFNALEWGKAIFGPAARPLAQLPLTVNSQGYLVAAHDFIEPVGPAFWERKS